MISIKRALSALVGIHSEMFAKADPRDLIYALNRRIEYKDRDLVKLQQQLASEREAHAEDRNRLIIERQNVEGQAKAAKYWHDNHTESQQQLASTLDKIDKLTRWRKQSEEPCPKTGEFIEYIDSADRRCVTRHGEGIGGHCRWRHTPESLQALEESEGGDV